MAEAKKQEDVVSELDEPVASKLFTEVKQGYREWDLDKVKYRTRFPVAKEENDANWSYSKAFNRALVEGLPTNAEMDKTIRQREIWSDKDDDEIDDMREKIGMLENILAKKNSKDTSKQTMKLATDLAVLRQSVIAKTSVYQSYMSQTVESKAEEAKTAYMVACCTETADGEKVWPDVDSFLVDKRGALVNTATYQYVTFTVGLADDYIEQLTETKFLRAGKDVDGESS